MNLIAESLTEAWQRLRFRLNRKRRKRFEELSLSPYQVYPEGSHLGPSFITEPRAPGFRFSRETPVASMGSCFAREIKDFLVARGYPYVQTEHNRWSVHASCSWERVYSAVNAFQIFDYTARQDLAPERIYPYRDFHSDLFRNKVGYPDRAAAEADILRHQRASRQAVEASQLFILTLGQNEVWRSRRHGFFFAARPPGELVTAGEVELRQLSVEENLGYLERAYALFRGMNPRARLLLTLSPVPSLATFYNENVVVRSSWNKAILRVAIGQFLDRHSEVLYFPSYEMVQTWRGSAYLSDNLHVRRAVVSAIMKSFLEAYASEAPSPADVSAPFAP